MQQRFRSDYPGEFVITRTQWQNGKKIQTREWIDNPIQNQHISHRAACIIPNVDLSTQFDYTHLQRHRGGLLSSKKLQTYGTGSIAKQMRLDFAVDNDMELLDELIANKYTEKSVVYTTAKNCVSRPGEFYLIPQNPGLVRETVPLYLAAFDGHKEIFMIGYNCNSPVPTLNWQKEVQILINTYAGTQFYTVGVESTIPDAWASCDNVSHLTWSDFITYCDV